MHASRYSLYVTWIRTRSSSEGDTQQRQKERRYQWRRKQQRRKYVEAIMNMREMERADEVAADSLEYVDDNLLLQAACTQDGMMVILQERGRSVLRDDYRGIQK